jgi:hypothetical protein
MSSSVSWPSRISTTPGYGVRDKRKKERKKKKSKNVLFCVGVETEFELLDDPVLVHLHQQSARIHTSRVQALNVQAGIVQL